MGARDLANDPEDLEPVAKIRYAEALIRAEHWCTEDDWLFWGNFAGYLNNIANLPEKTRLRASDWREFNRAQDMATGLIRMARED